jgi:hypothetical protein
LGFGIPIPFVIPFNVAPEKKCGSKATRDTIIRKYFKQKMDNDYLFNKKKILLCFLKGVTEDGITENAITLFFGRTGRWHNRKML